MTIWQEKISRKIFNKNFDFSRERKRIFVFPCKKFHLWFFQKFFYEFPLEGVLDYLAGKKSQKDFDKNFNLSQGKPIFAFPRKNFPLWFFQKNFLRISFRRGSWLFGGKIFLESPLKWKFCIFSHKNFPLWFFRKFFLRISSRMASWLFGRKKFPEKSLIKISIFLGKTNFRFSS